MNKNEQTLTPIEELRNLIYVNIISADNDEFGLSEEQKQQIMSRYNAEKVKPNKADINWGFVFECMPQKYKNTILMFFTEDPGSE